MARGKRKESPEGWERALPVEAATQEIVEEFHPHLAQASILVFLKPRASVRMGRVQLGKVVRPTAVLRAALNLANVAADYIIVLGRDIWVTLTPERQKAVLDHELTHCTGRTESGKWGVQGHEIEEFTSVVERRGAYTMELRLFVQACKQLEIPLGGGSREAQVAAAEATAAAGAVR